MAQKTELASDFWRNDYVRKLPPHGKLALSYVLGCENDRRPVLNEDMAMETGLDASECANWVEQFVNDDMVEMNSEEPTE